MCKILFSPREDKIHIKIFCPPRPTSIQFSLIILAIDFPGGKRNLKMNIRASALLDHASIVFSNCLAERNCLDH